MSPRATTPTPSFGAAVRTSRRTASSGALCHIESRIAHLSAGGKPLWTSLCCMLFMLIFLGEAANMHPMYVLLLGTGGGMFIWGLHHPPDGDTPLLPIHTRTRISIDAVLVLLPAALLLPLAQLAAHGAAWDRYSENIARVPDHAFDVPMGLDGTMSVALGMVLLGYPLVMAGMVVPPKRFSWRAMMPVMPVAGLIALGWALGITDSLLGSTLLAAAATTLVLATATLDWPESPGALTTLIPALGKRGPLARAGWAPSDRVRADVGRGVARWSAIIALGSALGWGALLLTSESIVSAKTAFAVTMVALLVPRMLAMVSGLDLPWTATGFNKPFDATAWASLPVKRRSLEGWSLLHYLAIALVCLACDALMLALVLALGEAELSGGSIAFMMMGGSCVLLPWLALALHLVRFRFRGVGTMIGAIVVALLGFQLFPFLIGLAYFLLMRSRSELLAGIVDASGPPGLFVAFLAPAAAMLLGLWVALLGGMYATIPKRNPA